MDTVTAAAEHATVFTFALTYANGTALPTIESVDVVLDSRDRDADDAWAVRHLGLVWHHDGRWVDDPPRTSANAHRFAPLRYPLHAALAIATAMAPTYTADGRPGLPRPQEHPDG